MNDFSQDIHLEAGRQRLATDLRAVIEDADALLRQTAQEAGHGYGEARSRLESSLRSAREQLIAVERSMVDGVRRGAEATDRYVHEHPWQSVGASAGVGAGIGLLVGLLLARR
ncbi:MAG: DUF883 domain-containing protein [Burkholderiales bacterium]|nr:DUF883 domain-containing protein [Burkholderiales bacterium]